MGHKHQNGRLAEPYAAYYIAQYCLNNKIKTKNSIDFYQKNINDCIAKNNPENLALMEGDLAGMSFADHLYPLLNGASQVDVKDIGHIQDKEDPTDLVLIVDGEEFRFSLKVTKTKSVSLGSKTTRSVLSRCRNIEKDIAQVHVWKQSCKDFYESPSGQKYLEERGGYSNNRYRDSRCSKFWLKTNDKTSSSIIQEEFENAFNAESYLDKDQLNFVLGEVPFVETLVCYIKNESGQVVTTPFDLQVSKSVSFNSGSLVVDGIVIKDYTYSVWNDGTLQFKRRLNV